MSVEIQNKLNQNALILGEKRLLIRTLPTIGYSSSGDYSDEVAQYAARAQHQRNRKRHQFTRNPEWRFWQNGLVQRDNIEEIESH